MVIHTGRENICIRDISNRRFMFDPQKEILVLGRQYHQRKNIVSSHAQELADAGITDQYDSFLRGWVGTSKRDPYGVIHFAPHIPTNNVALFERGFDTLQMFAENGASSQTLIRGFGRQWEQPLAAILPDMVPKCSVIEQLKQTAPSQEKKNLQPKQQER